MKKQIIIYIGVFILGIIAWSLIPSCEKTPITVNTNRISDSIKTELKKNFINKDSVKKEIIYRDSIRTVAIWKYRESKTLILPCDTMLEIIFAECDTVIKVDSTLISELKAELFISDLIIGNQKEIIKIDSLRIGSLSADSLKSHKKIRRLKRTRNFLSGVAIAFGLVAIAK